MYGEPSTVCSGVLVKKVPKILIYSSILIVTIYLFISITKNYVAHVYLSEYKNSLEDEEHDPWRQEHLLRKSLRLCSSNAEAFFELGNLYAYENPIGGYSKDVNMYYALS